MDSQPINITVEEIEPSFLYRFRAEERRIEFRPRLKVTKEKVTGFCYIPVGDAEDPFFLQDDLTEIKFLCRDSLDNIVLSPVTSYSGQRVKLNFTCMTDFLFFVKKLRG